jgi:hypothetical protein
MAVFLYIDEICISNCDYPVEIKIGANLSKINEIKNGANFLNSGEIKKWREIFEQRRNEKWREIRTDPSNVSHLRMILDRHEREAKAIPELKNN